MRPTRIVVADGAESEDSRQFRRHFSFCCKRVPNCWLALASMTSITVNSRSRQSADERMSGACGDVPVDGADVVAGLVFAYFLEGQACSLETLRYSPPSRSSTARLHAVAIADLT